MPFDGSEFHGTLVGPSAAGGGNRSIWRQLLDRIQAFLTPAPARPEPSLDFLTVHLLMTARSLIEDERNWIQHDYETRDGRFCAVGALRYAARFTGPQGALGSASRLLQAVARERGFSKIEKMNDRSSHERVLSAFDDAIARAKG